MLNIRGFLKKQNVIFSQKKTKKTNRQTRGYEFFYYISSASRTSWRDSSLY